MAESVAYLGTWVSFGLVPQALRFFTRVKIDPDTARCLTERAGAAAVATEMVEVERLEQAMPESPPGPEVQLLSVDGAMVPLVGGEWAEAKTLAVGTVVTDRQGAARARELSYFSRLTDAETFGRLALGELHRRGTARAGTVCAVMDGAEWLQRFVDLHRPDAVRILDFAHAAEHLGTVAQAVFGPGTSGASEWLGTQLHTLKHGDPGQVLGALATLPLAGAADPVTAREVRDGTVQYLEKRRAQVEYADFRARGYPIGSGSVESANKLVVEARLKGSGRRWARGHVNAMLALRGLVCSGRWDATWPELWQRMRRSRRPRPGLAPHAAAEQRPAAAQLAPGPPLEPADTTPSRPKRAPTIVDGHPTPEHPWRKFQVFARRSPKPDAKI